ncbi:hypothetical protein McanMca71_001078 [Microsporum canis]|uniref:Uncharacterized protein n=1 Tax=Arthroderma otae (strain ATCC MYA-4605 / CBS 113480) TaxID=554155 RepID=C5FHD9_ARTOC|nr:conserved hypothetical protein [Microsporum canis CBS 113480]EEQ28858.1 conserved hypothetical protein [Microsporum canis CBS 113480]
MGGGPKIRYPTHVWSPAGGWYAQPSNWKFNTFVIGTTALGFAALLFNYSAQHEHRDKFPEPGRFFPSRWWSKQIIEHERAVASKSDS